MDMDMDMYVCEHLYVRGRVLAYAKGMCGIYILRTRHIDAGENRAIRQVCDTSRYLGPTELGH